MLNFGEPLAIAARNRRATSSENREDSGLQRYKACQVSRRMIIAPYVCYGGQEVIPSRGEIAATCATISQKRVIGCGSWLRRHTPRSEARPRLCLPEGQFAPTMSSAFLMTMA
jgi:hypothetical protein